MAATKRSMTVEAAEDSSAVACHVEAPADPVAAPGGDVAGTRNDDIAAEGGGVSTGDDGVTIEGVAAKVDVDGAEESGPLEPPQAGATATNSKTAPRMTRRTDEVRAVTPPRTCTIMYPLSLGLPSQESP